MKYYEVQTTLTYCGCVTIKAENEEDAQRIVEKNISLYEPCINTGSLDSVETLLNFDDDLTTYADDILNVRSTLHEKRLP